jgi:hypothetical protein
MIELTYNERRKKQLDMLRGIAKRSAGSDSIDFIMDAIRVLKFSQSPLKESVFERLICDWKDKRYFAYNIFYRNDSYDDESD